MNKLISILFLISCHIYGQVGIGTDTPDVASILHLESSNKGLLIPKLSESERNNIVSPPIGLLIYQTDNFEGFYSYTSSNNWSKISMHSEVNTFGDIKTGIQPADHSGWVKLDGRAKSTLTTSQQTAATALGIGNNLPNANNAYLVQNGGILGAITGTNTKTISRANLPNVQITTTTTGLHQHELPFSANYPKSNNEIYDFVYGGGAWTTNESDQAVEMITTEASRTAERNGTEKYYLNKAEGNHSHSIRLNGNVTQTSLDITPKSLSINTFIYLGN